MTARLMKRAALIAMGVILVGCLVWQFPLFHIVAITASADADQNRPFDAKRVAKAFWHGALRESFDKAADATAVIEIIRESPQTAREKFGRTVGLGRSYYFYLRGEGTIVSSGPRHVGVTLDEEAASAPPSEPDVLLSVDLLFGNTVRDATGLISAGDYANSQHFNEISTELNHIVESEVLPQLKKNAAVGRRIHFVGCAEVVNEARDLTPLKVVPIHIEFAKHQEAGAAN